MPYCSQCGTQVGERDAYCASCGQRQPLSAPPAADPLKNLSPQTATVLCYIPFLGWIASIVILATDHFRNDLQVRFHAYQGLYLFVAWLLVDQVLQPFFRFLHGGFRIDKLLEVALIIAWVFMLIKASQHQTYSLPIIGDLAHKSASEA